MSGGVCGPLLVDISVNRCLRHMECDEALTPQWPVPTPSGRCVLGRRQPVPCWSPSRSSHHVQPGAGTAQGRDMDSPGPALGFCVHRRSLLWASKWCPQLLDGAPVHAPRRRREQSLRPPTSLLGLARKQETYLGARRADEPPCAQHDSLEVTFYFLML